MKHLIAFLGYNQSRIQHPVYRQFVQAPFSRRDATLLFLSRQLEERELVHEVTELRRREGRPCELTFHICATFDNPLMGQQIIQTVTLIHRVYDCPCYVYGLLPDLDTCGEEVRNNVWKCLVAINNGVTDYPNIQLMNHCFLYHDASQVSLANFLFNIIQQPAALDEISRYGFIRKLVTKAKPGDKSYEIEFPSIFSTFNSAGLTYPEGEVRYYIHQSYLNFLLSYSRPAYNKVEMERCNEHAHDLLSTLPLTDEKVTQLGDSFIDINQRRRNYQASDEYWNTIVANTEKDLQDLPREEWVHHLRNNLEVSYQTRFRDKGVEFFYKLEKKNTAMYCQVLLAMLQQGVRQIMLKNPYPPETSLDIVRSIINKLQQEAFGYNRELETYAAQLKQMELELEDYNSRWDAMGFFDRMRGRDKQLFSDYCELITKYYKFKTRRHGVDFANKLLNELIPQINGLGDTVNRLAQFCQDAYDATSRYLQDNLPSQINTFFPSQPIVEAAQAIRVDEAQLYRDYARFAELLYDLKGVFDGDALLQQLREMLTDDIDGYIHQRILEGTMPAVLDVSIVDRIDTIYADLGGVRAYINQLKNETALSLKVKGEGRRNEQYLLIAPSGHGVDSHIESSDSSSLQLLHIKTGISLSDLDGFTGQRMFIEPSIF